MKFRIHIALSITVVIVFLAVGQFAKASDISTGNKWRKPELQRFESFTSELWNFLPK